MVSIRQKLSEYFSRLTRSDENSSLSLSDENFRTSRSYDLRSPTEKILEKIRAKSSQGPIVVIMGENHLSACHRVLNQIVVEKLLRSSSASALMSNHMGLRVAYGCELPHNILAERLERHFSISFSEEERARINQSDGHGQMFLKLCLVTEPYGGRDTPAANKNADRLFFQQSISMRLNDAARFYDKSENKEFWEEGAGVYLDSADLETGQMVQKFAPAKAKERISAVSDTGMSLRNRMIVARALTHLNDVQADVYIQSCGTYHVLGYNKGYEFKDSLCALFKDTGFTILPVFPMCRDYDLETLSAEALSVLKSDGVIVSQFDDVMILPTPELDRDQMRQIHEDSGREFTLYDEIPGAKEKWEQELRYWIEGVIKRDISFHPLTRGPGNSAKALVSCHP